MKSVAIVVQRWHPEITGGSEQEAGMYAKYLSAAGLRVDVLTTTARDATSWADHYPPGVEAVGDFRVLRFPVAVGRSAYWAELHEQLLREYVALRSEPEAPDVNFFSNSAGADRNSPTIRWPIALQEEWIRRQGPHSPELLEYLTAHREHYDCFVFLTYLFSPTYFGALNVPPERVLFVPTLHDEAPAYLSVFGMLARRVAGILWNTNAERQLGEKLWGPLPARIAQSLGGLGIDCPESDDASRAAALQDLPAFAESSGGASRFALYCGRINAAKGCQAMIESFLAGYELAATNPAAFAPGYPRRLILTGDLQMKLPEHPALVYAGYVSEAQKFALMSAADVFIMPSGFESLSVVTLEALGQGTPVLANAQSDVVEDHIVRSGGGRTYNDTQSFIQNLAQLSYSRRTGDQTVADAARRYVRENYSHEQVSARIVAAVRAVIDAAVQSVWGASS